MTSSQAKTYEKTTSKSTHLRVTYKASQAAVSSNSFSKTNQSTPSNDMIKVVFVSLILDLLAFTVILPLMPSLIDYYSQNSHGGLFRKFQNFVQYFREIIGAPDEPRLNAVLFGGLIGSLFSFLQFLSSPLIGAASDIYGRKYVMLICLQGMALSYLIWAFSKNFTLFIISRIIGGISKGNISLSTAIITDLTTPATRIKAMAAIGIAFSIGFVVGPMFGAFFAFVQRKTAIDGFIIPAVYATILTVINIFYCIFFFKETLPVSKRSKNLDQSLTRIIDHISPIALFQFRAVKKLKNKDLSKLHQIGLIYFLYLFFYSGLEFTLTFLTHIRFEYSSMNQGLMFLFIGIIMSIVQGGFVRKIRVGDEKRTALIGLIIIIPSFLIIGLTFSSSLFFIGLSLYAVASAIVVPSLTTIVSNYGFDDQKGTVMGIFRSLGSLARSVGPILASIIFWSVGPEACYVSGGLGIIIPFILLKKMNLN